MRARALTLVTLLVSSLSVVGPAAPASAQPVISGIQLSFGPGFPGNVTVGEQNRNAAILITNNSFGALGTVPVTLTNIRLNPSCDSGTVNSVGEPCTVPEMRALPGPIFNIDPVAVGRAGTACGGQMFTVSPPDANGTVTFIGPPVVLGPPGTATQSCVIDFTFDVLQRPTDGDTFAVANATATALDPSIPDDPATAVEENRVTLQVSGASSAIIVAAATPSIVTQASVPGVAPTVPGPQVVTSGTAFQDTAVVTGVPGGPPLTGNVTFRLFRSDPANPGFPTCAEVPVQTFVAPTVAGPPAANGAPTASATFIPAPIPGPGRYVFVATYDEPPGTDPNYASVSSPCADPNEQVRVNPVLPAIAVEKTANPTVLNEPGGPVVFTVRVINTGPNALTLTSLTDNVYGDLNGRPAPAGGTPCVTAPAGSMPPTPPLLAANGGTFTCQFIGQVPAPGSGQPGPNHTDVVTAIGTDAFGNTATAMDDAVVTIVPVPPAVAITKTANPLTRTEPGGDFTFDVVVTNTSTVEPLTITSLDDDIYGPLQARGTCTTAIGTVLAVSPGPGNTYSCSFTVPFTGAPRSQTDIVTVIGRDDDGQTAMASDDAVIAITPIPPAVAITKTASPLSRPEPGGDFTYTVVVTNTSTVEPLTITTLTDSVYGDLTARGTCNTAVGTLLAVSPGPGNTYSCTFTAPFTPAPGAPRSLTDVATVTGVDDDGQTAMASDDAVVMVTDVLPDVRVVKTANPTSMAAPGGTFTFTLVVTNPSGETITIRDLDDDIYGDLAAPRAGSTCNTLIGTTLAPGASSAPCTFTGAFTGVAGASQTDTVTVVADDDEGNVVTDTDDAVVTLTGAPSIRVDKTADPTSLPEPGGTFTFTAVVTNTGPEPLVINSLNDDIYGNVATIPGSTCGALIGTTLAPGASTAPCTFPGVFNGVGGATQIDVITVVGTSPNGTQVTDTDDATVTITNVNPTIAVDKTASPLTMNAPGGTFTFTVVVTNTSAEPVIITDLDDDIYGDLAAPRPGSTCNTLIGTTLAPGASSPPCTFTGDFMGVGGASQTDTVTARAVDLQGNPAPPATDDATVTLINIVPDITVEKRATPTTRPAPGGTFTFDVTVINTGPNPLTITTLTDDIYGDLRTQGTCTTAIGTVLPSGGTYMCSFPGNFTGIGGQSQTDTVTVTGVDAAGVVVDDTDDATVTLTNVPPTVRVVKTANPLSLPEPGGTFTFTAVVTNTSAERVAITSLNDDIYGNLATRPGSTCGALIGTFLAPGASSNPCTFPGSFIGDAGASQTDVVTVVVTDDEGTTATDDDDAVVTITDIPPAINVVKTADPLTRPAPGGTFTFNVVVTNNSFEPVTVTSLTDDIYGNLNGRGTCAIGAVLAPNGGTYSCSFTGDFNGPPNASQRDVVTVVGVDNDNTTVTDTDDATVNLTPLPATLTTQVSAGAVGASVSDTATLAGGFNPTGTITFRLHGPNDDTCTAAPIFTNVKPVTGTTDPRIVVSDSFILPSPGIYHFVATYSGDANNPAVGPTACQDPNETIGVGRLPINLTTQASPTVSLGGAIFDTATIGGGFNLTGTVTFRVFGPDNPTCSGTPVFTSVKQANGNGTVTSDSFTPTAPGVYRWVAEYSGDANNAPAVTACDDPLEQVTVTPLPVIRVDKTAVPDSLPVPGGDVLFNVLVTNTSNVPLTIRTLTDNVFGDVTGLTGSTCNTAIGTVLAPAPGPGNTYSCRFFGAVRGPTGTVHTDVVTVTATDNRGNTVRDDDDAVVRIVGVPPTITTTKVATPSSLPEPGGTFTFTFTVVNTGPDPVTVTSLVDDVYGNLNGRGTCAIGARLAGNGGAYTCSFTGNFFGNAGAAQTDIITTIAVDDRGQTVTSQSTATVRITDVPPTITVTKSPDPVSRPEPGGSFRFTVTVTNTSFEPVTITSLVDDIYGDLNGRGSCAIGVRLAPGGGSYSCAFDGEFRGRSGDSQTDIVTVIVVDDDNTPATAIARAVVTLTPPGTQPVVPPPPPPPPVPPAPRVLVRTGSDLSGPARLAGLLLLVGMTLVAATRKFGEGGPGLVPAPVGPGGSRGPRGPESGGGGRGFGGDSWFGGTPVRPPRGPLGGLGAGLAEPPAAPPAPPETEPASDQAWDAWVGERESSQAVVTPVVAEAPLVAEASVVAEAPVVADPPLVAEAVLVPEVIVPTVVQVRSSSALDAAALDAAQALSAPRTPAPPAGGRRGRKHGRS